MEALSEDRSRPPRSLMRCGVSRVPDDVQAGDDAASNDVDVITIDRWGSLFFEGTEHDPDVVFTLGRPFEDEEWPRTIIRIAPGLETAVTVNVEPNGQIKIHSRERSGDEEE